MHRTGPPVPLRAWTGLVIVLAVSRFGYWLMGVRFDAGMLWWAQQLLDPDMLEHDLWRSLLYLHMQPPGFNLFVGIVLKLSGPYHGLGFQVAFLAGTVLMAFCLYGLLKDFGLSGRWSFVLTSIVIVAPTVVQYENMLLYTHLERVGLVVVARLLQRWVLTGRRRDLVGFSAVLSALALTRTVYQPLWLVLAGVLLVAFAARAGRRPLALALLAPLLLSGAVIVKNAVLFDWATMSTLQGYNLHHMGPGYMSAADTRAMIADGGLSHDSLQFQPCRDAPRRYPGQGPDVRLPALDRFERSADPRIFSWNHRSVVECERHLYADAVRVIREHPYAYARAVNRAVATGYYSATPEIRTRQGNQDALAGPARVEALALGAVDSAQSPYTPGFGTWHASREEWLVLAAGLACLVGLPWVAFAARRRGDAATAVMAAFLWLVVATTHIGTQLFETGENARFRSTSDPLLLAGVVVLVVVVRRHRAGPAVGRPSEPDLDERPAPQPPPVQHAVGTNRADR